HDPAKAPRLRLPHAQEADDVATVDVQALSRAGLIAARVRVAQFEAFVAHVADEIAACVLRDRAAEVRPDSPKRARRVIFAPAFDREAADPKQTAPILELPADLGQL